LGSSSAQRNGGDQANSLPSYEYFVRPVPNADIAAQDYNLSVSIYVEQEDNRVAVNITELNSEIERIVAREDVLRREIAAIVVEIEGGVSL
jgi:type I restriction enzyme M protein